VIGTLLLVAAAAVNCPPMGAYTVTGMSAQNLPLPDALGLLFEGTAWAAVTQGPSAALRVSYADVSGPLDQVFNAVIGQAGKASTLPLAALRDPTTCKVSVTIKALPPAPAKVAPPVVAQTAGESVTVKPASLPKAVAQVPVAAVAAVPSKLSALVTPVAALPPDDTGLWRARRGETLRYTIEAWAREDGWTVMWDAPSVDYEIAAPLTYRGSMLDAIEGILRTHGNAKPIAGGGKSAVLIAKGFVRQKIVQVREVK